MVTSKLSLLQCVVPTSYMPAVTKRISIMSVAEVLNIRELNLISPEVHTFEKKEIESQYSDALRKLTELMTELEMTPGELSTETRIGAIKPIDEKTLKKIESLRAKTVAIRERIELLQKEMQRLSDYETKIKLLQGINIELNVLRQLKFFKYYFCRIPTEHIPRLLRGIKETKSIVEILRREKEQSFIFVITSRKNADRIKRVLSASFCETIDIPLKFAGHPEDMLNNIFIEKERIEIAIRNFKLKLHRMALQNHEWIYATWNKMKWMDFILKTATSFGSTNHFSILTFWVPQKHRKKIEQEVNEATDGKNICEWLDGKTAIKKYRRLRIPTLLQNNRFFKPFETLVAAYGIPRYTEIDPTPLVALTYIVMFGMMFGDVGHGAALVLLAYLLKRFFKEKLGGLTGIMIACGISSIVWGALYGSIFGYEDVIHAIWMSPMHDVMQFLKISIVWGIMILVTGYALNIINKISEERFKELLTEEKGLPGAIFYVSLALAILFAYKEWGITIPIITGIATLGWIFVQELRRKEGIFVALIKIFSFVIENISNTISFIRVGAFALNHVALSLVIFALTGMMEPTSTGTIIRAIILVFGNLLIIMFEGFIVGIQVTRLEFYEFFSKFYQGDGRRFKPLSYLKE